MFIFYLKIILILLLILYCGSIDGRTMEKKIYLVPIGDVQTEDLERLQVSLSSIFNLSCEISISHEVPQRAYNPKRRQYLSTAILSELRKDIPLDAERVLGVTNFDLYVPSLNFVFGEADLRGKVAVISLCRLHQSYYGLPEDSKLFKDRMIKEAVHEIGHTYGLGHCQNSKCVMFFSNRLMDTDRKGKDFCNRCRRKLPYLK